MKLTFTFFAFTIASFSLSSQITIAQSDFIFVSKAVYQNADITTIPGLNTSPAAFWDLGSVQKKGNRREILFAEISNHPDFPQATERSEAWALFGPLAVRQHIYYKKDASGYSALGIGYEKQTLPLGSLSGNNNDSVTFLTQTHTFSAPYKEISFPLTENTTWSASSVAKTNFTMSLLLLGFNKTPCYFVNYFTASHEVVSTGTCRIPSKGSPGNTFDALLLKTEELRVDSFYLNGQPADPFLLAAMGVEQGDSLHTYLYRIFRKDAGMQQMAVIEFEDDTYTTVKKAEYSAEFDVVSVGDITIDNGIMVYPNPVTSHTFFVSVEGEEIAPQYTVTDNTGKQINPTIVTQGNNGYTVILEDNTAAGIYYLSVTSNTKTARIKLLVK